MIRTLTLITLLFAPVAAYADDGRVTGVVELFTSQGCSSCPPADALLQDYVADQDVLALSWHVDYWNYLGWEDTFSKADFTQRQQLYALSFQRRGVYTPQAIVNGRDHAVGSRKRDIDGLLKGGVQPLTASLDIARDAAALTISCREQAAADNATLSIVYFKKDASVAIGRGENGGRKITYHNIVRGIDTVGMVKDGSMETSLPISALRERAAALGASDAALLLQVSAKNGVQGPIIAAHKLGAL